MCQSMDRTGFYILSEKELESTQKYLEDLKFLYCKNMYNDDFLEDWGGRENILKRIKDLEQAIKAGGYHYEEDAELRCCGQG